MGSPARSSPHSQGSEVTERFSRKVFVGGLPPDIDEGVYFIILFTSMQEMHSVFGFLLQMK